MNEIWITTWLTKTKIFRDLRAPVENVQEYRLRGYHPLHLRDSLLDGRYLVLRKLGYGSFPHYDIPPLLSLILL
jgi:hypothetical protein